jgi:hypothetical protein
MAKSKVHVVPHADGWATRREGSDRVSRVFQTKAEADEAGRKAAKADHVELIIHRKDGTIQDKDSFGHDPNPPTDTVH